MINGGYLNTIPKMCKCPKLSDIHIFENPLTSIENEAFAHLPNLETLEIAWTNPYDWSESRNFLTE